MTTHKLKHNITAVVDPGVNDDNTQGYEECSSWINNATVKLFMCANPATGAAVWKETTFPDHAATHVGADAIQSATAAQDGLATSTQIAKLDAIAAGADVTGSNPPQGHSASHTDGSDDVALASGATKGLMAAADKTKLDGVEAAADVTDAANVDAAGAVMDSDISEAEGFVRKTGAGAYEAIKSNLSATVDPTVNDDSASGYAVHSPWVNTVLEKQFVLVNPAVGAAIWKETTAGAAANTHEMFFPVPTAGSQAGDYEIASVSTNSNLNFTFCIPADFASLVALEISFSPESGAAQTARDIDLTSDYGANGESITQHSEADTTSTYDLSGKAEQWTSIDISGVFSSLASGDICGIKISHNTIGGSIRYAGVRLLYNK